MSLLSLRGLTIRFGQDVAVDNLSLDLEPGHMLAKSNGQTTQG